MPIAETKTAQSFPQKKEDHKQNSKLPKALSTQNDKTNNAESISTNDQKEPSNPLPVFRPSDTRPKHDAKRLQQIGIARYESKHLLLYTDIDPEIAKTLPPIIDQAYKAWEDYFGALPPNREQSIFQMTGYLMRDKELFRRVGLLPKDLREFVHGRHRGAEFWMNDQKYDYYRRHLLIHESTHCFMTIMPNVNPSLWYLEGMAELFGTHRIDDKGNIQFRVMPQTREEVAGLGRITMIRDDVESGAGQTFQKVINLKANDYLKTKAYAWSWGLCHFLDHHSRYAKRFREMGQYTADSQFSGKFRETFKQDLPDLQTEWLLFASNLQYRYDCKQAAIKFSKGHPIKHMDATENNIQANRGWQSSGLQVEKGQSYQIDATGYFTLASEPKPWVSEANGISFRYFQGHPLGNLLAAVRIEQPQTVSEETSMLKVYPLGNSTNWTAPATGTLYLRLNDSWSELVDNTGSVIVTIQVAK